MKKLVFIIGLFGITSFIGKDQKLDIIKIEVVNCMSSITYSSDGDSVIIKDKFYRQGNYSSNKVDTADFTRFLGIANQMLKTKGDEVLDNPCIVDGFHVKVYIRLNKDSKKIFIGNYYDTRVDSLINVFDKYINREDEVLKYNAFRYSKSAERIKQMINSQTKCTDTLTEQMKNHLLHSFCEY